MLAALSHHGMKGFRQRDNALTESRSGIAQVPVTHSEQTISANKVAQIPAVFGNPILNAFNSVSLVPAMA